MITCEYPPQFGGVSDYSEQVAAALRASGADVHVWCAQFDGFTPVGIRRVSRLIDDCPAPRRLLVQWVPHGYGRRSMNVEFCRWLVKRKRDNPGEQIDLMIHEPGLGLGEGGFRHNVVALVHRVMLRYLLKSADRVWISIPAWEAVLRPLLSGREIPIECAPVPSNIPVSISGPDADYAIGYFGHYDQAGIGVVMRLLEALPERIALIGRGADRIPMHQRTIVIGETDAERLSRAIASSWVMCHHYIDGLNGRRGTLMASLAHGKAVVTVEGRLTEPFWRESNAVSLCSVGDVPAMAGNIRALLRDHGERVRMGTAAAALYRERFSVDRTIAKLLR